MAAHANHIEHLESRRLFSSNLAGSVLTITGGAGNDRITLLRNQNTLKLSDNGQVRTFQNAQVKSLVVNLGNGNDTFSASGPITQPATISGGNGNDTVTSGAGNDSIRGGAGNDQLNGGGGIDRIWGETGNDTLHGNAGDDSLFGGKGNDSLLGDDGADVLVDIGGGNRDTLLGGSGTDRFWCDDDVSEQIIDPQLLAVEPPGVHRVAAFFDGLSKELDGQNFSDPAAQSSATTWRNFRNAPLFGSGGPTDSDVRQGHADSSFLLAPLAAVARKSPAMIRDHIVDLGDGTYAVKLDVPQKNSMAYVRVDADLPVESSDPSQLYYAGLGANTSTWAALYEKAMCIFRCACLGVPASYSAYIGQDSAASGLSLLGIQFKSIDRGGSAAAWLKNLRKWLDAGQPAFVTLSGPDTPAGFSPVNYQTLIVQSVQTTSVWIPGGGPLGLGHFAHVPVSVTLRNVMNYDGIGNDGNRSDGIVTLSLAQFDSGSFNLPVGGSIGIE